MDRKLARSLISDTFTQRFDKSRFLHFTRNLLNHVNETKATSWNKTYIKDAYKPGIKKFERVGTYTDLVGEQIDILIVHLEKESSLERARTFLRNFVADYLVTRGQKEAALAAFVSPSEADWRFSLVKMEYTTEQSESGIVKVSESLTPARRYSFLVGENEDSHTAQSQLLDILADTDHNPSLESLERAFGVERVTKEFFEQYKALFLDLKDELDELLECNPKVRRDFKSKNIDTVDFAKKLLGQVVFLYFLQKKGWFGVARDAEWGTGPKNYLRQLFQSRERIGAFSKSGSGGVNFFNDILEPLFYEALAKSDREDDYYGHFHCKIPFLNGGLFDPLNGYDWIHTDINLPDELFSNDERTDRGDIGTGILDVFDRYNFTVNEAEPLEKEVAVDPEMLGKVFENLLEIKERKSKGSFYTPREIVHYMCRESLVSYLEKELSEAKVSRGDIEALLRVGEQAADFELARLDKSTGYKPQLPKSIELNSSSIDSSLEAITVCDPAVGSGAFLVGMMSEIVRARKTLTPYFSDRSRRTVYEFKRHAIQSSLYGVDIDPGAVEIAKLRLWLSLVVDEDDIKEIKPLPNLDYKIMQGDSLVEEFEGVKLFDKRLVEQPSLDVKAQKTALNARIVELSHQFFDLHGRGHRDKQTRRAIEKEIALLKKEMKALDAPVVASSLPTQREIGELFSEAQRKLPQLEQLHRELFEASSSARKKAIRDKLTALEWEIMEATVREGIQQEKQILDHLKQELNSARRKNEPSRVIEKLERRIEDLKLQKKDREEASKHLQALRNSNVKPFFLWRLHFLEVFQQKQGFDVVVGNPPYVRADSGEAHLATRRAIERSGRFETLWEKRDLYVAFIERGFKLLTPGGIITLIVSDAYCHSKYAQKSQNWFLKHGRVRRLDFLSRIKVFEATVRNMVFFFQRSEGASNRPERRVHGPEFGTVELLPSAPQLELNHRAFFPEEGTVNELMVPTIELNKICYISKGMVVHANERIVPGSFELGDLVSDKRDALHSRAFVEGKLVDRWLPRKHKWLEWGTKRAPGMFSRPTFKEMYDVTRSLFQSIWQRRLPN
jgi:type I restriction-modification system DNA methylase subunit